MWLNLYILCFNNRYFLSPTFNHTRSRHKRFGLTACYIRASQAATSKRPSPGARSGGCPKARFPSWPSRAWWRVGSKKKAVTTCWPVGPELRFQNDTPGAETGNEGKRNRKRSGFHPEKHGFSNERWML